jgi:hypothetical protein
VKEGCEKVSFSEDPHGRIKSKPNEQSQYHHFLYPNGMAKFFSTHCKSNPLIPVKAKRKSES